MDEKKQKKEITVVKKNALDKVKDGFLADAGINLKNYIWQNVIKPGVVDLVSTVFDSIFQSAIDTKNVLLYKDDAVRDRRRGDRRISINGRSSGYTSYSKQSIYYDDRDDDFYKYESPTTTYRLDDRFTCRSRAEAEDLLNELKNEIRAHKQVSIFDLYEFCGKTVDYTARDWGWYDLASARIRMVPGLKDPWELVLPRPVSLRK